MHRISDNRMSGSALRNFRTYQSICGPEGLRNTMIVTNMWSQIDVTRGVEHETELKTSDAFFGHAIRAGAQLVRHNDTQPSARDIVRTLLANQPRPLLIQQELVDEKKKVFQTTAGQGLLHDLGRLQQRYTRESMDLEKELAEARQQDDSIALAEIQEEHEKVEENKSKLEREKKKLLQLELTYAEVQLNLHKTRTRRDATTDGEDKSAGKKKDRRKSASSFSLSTSGRLHSGLRQGRLRRGACGRGVGVISSVARRLVGHKLGSRNAPEGPLGSDYIIV